MSDRMFTLAMVYAGWPEAEIRAEVYMRLLERWPR